MKLYSFLSTSEEKDSVGGDDGDLDDVDDSILDSPAGSMDTEDSLLMSKSQS